LPFYTVDNIIPDGKSQVAVGKLRPGISGLKKAAE